MENLQKALNDSNVIRILELLRLTDEMLTYYKNEEPEAKLGPYEYGERLKDLVSDLEKVLIKYDLTIKDVPEELIKYQEDEDDW